MVKARKRVQGQVNLMPQLIVLSKVNDKFRARETPLQPQVSMKRFNMLLQFAELMVSKIRVSGFHLRPARLDGAHQAIIRKMETPQVLR